MRAKTTASKTALLLAPLMAPALALGFGAMSAAAAHDVRALGDGKLSSAPQQGHLYACQTRFDPNAPGSRATGPWVQGDSFNPAEKPTVDGAVDWPDAKISVTRQGDTRIIAANNLPTHSTGVFPVHPSDDAYQYDRNPNGIRAQTILLELPAEPQLADDPSCVPMGMIGFTLTGGALYNALDARGRDAAAYEMLDACGGHPQRQGQYHYHDHSDCLPAGRDESGHSELVGYALDGFGVFGAYDTGGTALTNADLDACHGHVGPVTWDGETKTIYHYHMTSEYPYSIGCFRSTPVNARQLTASDRPQGRSVTQGGARVDGRPAGRPAREQAEAMFTAVARDLGISVDDLRRAMGPPPPDFRRAAQSLGISEQRLREAFRRHRPA